MAFRISFNEEKNQLLKATRGICFEDVIVAINEGNLIADIKHPNTSWPNQRVFIVIIVNYIYAIPYVKNVEKNEIFLKTVYPSRVLTKRYMKGSRK